MADPNIKTPVWYGNLGIISYGNRVTANAAVRGVRGGGKSGSYRLPVTSSDAEHESCPPVLDAVILYSPLSELCALLIVRE